MCFPALLARSSHFPFIHFIAGFLGRLDESTLATNVMSLPVASNKNKQELVKMDELFCNGCNAGFWRQVTFRSSGALRLHHEQTGQLSCFCDSQIKTRRHEPGSTVINAQIMDGNRRQRDRANQQIIFSFGENL